jgi:hypothetical protein
MAIDEDKKIASFLTAMLVFFWLPALALGIGWVIKQFL